MLDSWLERHPYLDPIGRLHRQVEAALGTLATPHPIVPDWNDYLDEFLDGTPVLGGSKVALDLAAGGTMILSLVDRLEGTPLDTATLGEELRRGCGEPGRVVAWLQGDDDFAPSSPGLLRYLGWTAMAAYLRPVAHAFATWRDDERWMRRYCPLCGSSPAMAQLIGTDPGRRRFLVCGCCGSRWRYRRTVCPYCEADSHQLASLAIDGEPGLRIDWCESCRGYLKTYDGEGSERLLLADWSSLHLDVIALDRGLARKAVSLYEIPALP